MNIRFTPNTLYYGEQLTMNVENRRIPRTKDYFVHGILLRLWQEDGHVEHFGSRGLWKITEEGIAVIEGSR